MRTAEAVLDLVATSDLSAYDCEFVATIERNTQIERDRIVIDRTTGESHRKAAMMFELLFLSGFPTRELARRELRNLELQSGVRP